MICMTLYPLFFSVKCVVLIWCVSLCDLAHVISMFLQYIIIHVYIPSELYELIVSHNRNHK